MIKVEISPLNLLVNTYKEAEDVKNLSLQLFMNMK